MCVSGQAWNKKKPRSGEETNGASLEALIQLAHCKLSRSAVIQNPEYISYFGNFKIFRVARTSAVAGLHSDLLACDAPRSMKEGL
jgi:hypothetical protein